jgi:hypothetical protein
MTPFCSLLIFLRELADRKAQFAQEISNALMQAEDFKKLADDASKRAEEAEQYQKLVQVRLSFRS